MKKIIIAVVVLIAVVTLGIKGKGLLEKRKSEVANEAIPKVSAVSVSVIKARQGELENRVPFLAQILSDKSIKLSTKLAGFIEKIYVEESQKVKKGTLLVKIDAIELRSSILALEATLSAQKSDLLLTQSIYLRNKKLFNIGGLAKEKLDISRVALNAKKSLIENTTQKISQLSHQFWYLQIVAPFDGEIDTLFLQEGDLAAAGKPILSLSNGVKKLVFSYAPTKGNDIKKAQAVFLEDRNIGEIKSIYTTSKNGLIRAEVVLSKAINLPVGSSLNIEVLTSKASGCIVPSDTVLHKKEGTFVMTYAEGKFRPMRVNVKMQEAYRLLISPCPKTPIAQASEVKLAQLPAYDKVNIIGAKK